MRRPALRQRQHLNGLNMKIIKISALIGLLAAACAPARAQDFRINQKEYFENAGAGVMVYSDVYSEGHQGGVTLVLNGHRHAANGDVRFEVSQGQWQGLPRRRSRTVDTRAQEIRVVQSFPDSSRHLAGFNLELEPSKLLGQPWILDDRTGVFPHQPVGPTRSMESNTRHLGDFNPRGKASLDQLLLDRRTYNPMIADDLVSAPLATGRKFVLNPHDGSARMAPVDINHIDGYVQGPSTLCSFAPGDVVPGLNVGGWHDAGDYDIRVESQANEAYILALAVENLGAAWPPERT